jgi:hypothetical protein
MDKIVIRGGERLIGEVEVSGSKNSTLPIFVSCLLSEGENLFYNVPNLRDVQTIVKVLSNLGVIVGKEEGGAYWIDATKASNYEAPYDLVKTMRASILVLGPLLARMGKATVSLPGGCAIGARPINLHLMGLEAMGAKIELRHGYIEAKADVLKGANISFDTVTVTGTENLMMAAALAKGRTTLQNAAMEPEVVDLANVLNKMGAKINGAGYFNHAVMTNAQLLHTFGDYAQGKAPLNTSGTEQQAGIGVAFNGLKFGKMEQCHRDRFGLADIRAELGYNFLQKEKYGLGFNLQIAAPTGTSRHAEFAFDATIGNGNHWEVGGGAVGHYILWKSKNEDQRVGLYLDANLTHMITAKEQRTFDLKGKPNSRYMLAEQLGRPVNYLRARTTTTAATFSTPIAQFQGVFAPVANLTTMHVNVYSRIQADIAAMLNYTRKSWEFDLWI